MGWLFGSSLLILCLDTVANAQAANPSEATDAAASDVVIRVDDFVIRQDEFRQIFDAAVRNKYYHGKVPEAELIEFRQQVAEDLVDQMLVHREALEAGVEPDMAEINAGIERYDNRYAGSPGWQEQRSQVIPLLRQRLARRDVIEKMREKVRQLPPSSESRVLEYYRDNPDKFTEPERHWLSVILLAVPAYADESVWVAAETSAKALKLRIAEGEDFAGLAQEFSNHASAENGGDLGYLHQGMLDETIQDDVESLEIGETSEPLRTLEGVLLVRMNGVQKAKIRPFDQVRQRASDLLYRDRQDEAWKNYVTALKQSADIYIDQNLNVLK